MSSARPLKLAVFVEQIFWFDGRTYYTDEAFIKYLMAFGTHFEKIVFYTRVAAESKTEEYRLPSEKIEVHTVPWYDRVLSLWTRWPVIMPRVAGTFTRTRHEWDLLWLFMPNPLSLTLAELCRWYDKPFFMTVRQNLPQMVRHQLRGLNRFLAATATGLMERRLRSLVRRHPTFTVGEELYEIYKQNSDSVFRSTISLIAASDIVSPEAVRKRPDSTLRLFSVGRLSLEKGLVYLFEAVDRLVNEDGIDVRLRMGGKGPLEGWLRQEIARRGLGGHIEFLGFIPDADLLATYRASDIFVLPSLTEGLPQVLIESMACGVPAVASRVGGIPELIRDGENGLLVEPGSTGQLTQAIRRLARDNELRERITVNGLETARQHTVEAEVDRVMSVLRTCFPTMPL